MATDEEPRRGEVKRPVKRKRFYTPKRSVVPRIMTGVRLDGAERSELQRAAKRRGLVDANTGEPVLSEMLRWRNSFGAEFMPPDWDPSMLGRTTVTVVVTPEPGNGPEAVAS
jgi:hypothetical protein